MSPLRPPARSAFVLLLVLLSLIGFSYAEEEKWVAAYVDGKQVRVRDSRRPALYTSDFGDCMGSSSLKVTRFDAAFYKDNMTVLFHLEGETALKNESIMMYIGVYAYGESRFDLTFNPCNANIWSACPVQAGTPIEANGVIPINQQDIAGIPDLALSIPDFEGEAILRIFSNSTQSPIGCFSAAVTNSATFSQPASVGSVLGIFTVIAPVCSFATTIYGNDVPEMRKHYAHSMSVLVVFAVWHHIFYSGALSMNWPRVLVAFWSNYAWAGGMIYTESMQNTINKFIGSNKGNTSAVGAAGTGEPSPDLGGGYDIHQIYKRERFPKALNASGLMKWSKNNRVSRHLENLLAKREMADRNNGGYPWYGEPVKPGLPLPGNFSGFAGTLAQQRIPASNAFMTGLLWFLILIGGVTFAILTFKLLLEMVSKMGLIKKDRLSFFRAHYLRYITFAVLRIMFIGFFMMVFLSLFQFTYLASPAPVAVACVIFLIMLLGLGGLAGYACMYRLKFGKYSMEPDRLNFEKRKILKVIPWFGLSRSSSTGPSEGITYLGSVPWWRVRSASETKSIHDDEDYTLKFGWLVSRFRRTRWWFFVAWLVYEFIRACFLGGASGKPKVQVFGLLAVEFIAFIGVIVLRPFEGQRLNMIVVYALGFSKVTTVALSAAFDVSFNLPRIPATAIGIVIVVIQGILTIIVMVAIIIGAISTYFSLTRNREQIKPRRWNPIREKYFQHIDNKVHDVAPPPPPASEEPKGPCFSVNSIKRLAKIEDEDPEFVAEINGEADLGMVGDPATSHLSLSSQRNEMGAIPRTRSRAGSVQSQMSHSNLPYGARVHRASWSTRDFSSELHGSYTPERRRSRGNSLVTPNTDSRPASRPLKELDARMMGSSGNVAGASENDIPLPGVTPRAMSPVGANITSHRRTRSGSVRGAYPPLQRVMSEDEVLPLPNSGRTSRGNLEREGEGV
ncbi:TRP-domain-containing protein [Westerdykella ornata]|uniref:TRP-domain-containing protein n=1 Tax=Westerdykella ornata TaxID=318751 RepID=A0A6A6JZV7_WESOR|nr:TRP-domain-containing protein [Westerdykella ornata]KAF2281623.1 TRP-domain-containing protein [Westerdykella ornata]